MPEAAVRETNPQSAAPESSYSPLIPQPSPPQSQAIVPAKPKRDTLVLDHWYALVPDFNMSSQEFYSAIENDLTKRKVPGMTMSRVAYGEGGILSDQREYLRFTRERLTFDICAAPFGTSFFFSCRFAETTPKVRIVHVAAVLLFFGAIWLLLQQWVSPMSAIVIMVLSLFFILLLLGNVAAMGLADLDTWLLNSPVLGGMYLNWFRKETYYREDTRLMYLETVNAITKEAVQHVSGVNGIHLITFKERSPVLSELYKTNSVSLPKQPAPA